jgi:hypothetical protein
LHLQYTAGAISEKLFNNLKGRAMKKLSEIQDEAPDE